MKVCVAVYASQYCLHTTLPYYCKVTVPIQYIDWLSCKKWKTHVLHRYMYEGIYYVKELYEGTSRGSGEGHVLY